MAPPVSKPASTVGPFRRALVLANPISGRGRGARAAEELCEGLSRMGVPAEVYLTRARRDALGRLRTLTPETDLVLAVGGDGTLREVFEGLIDPSIPVALLPFGTANVMAHELRLPRDVDRALEIVAARRTQSLDVARVNGQLAVFSASVGFDSQVVQALERRRTGPITKRSYLPAAVQALRHYRRPRLRVWIDDQALPGEYGGVMISNTVGYAGMLRLAPDARLDDGNFEVYLFRTGRRGELVSAFLRGLVRHLPGGPVSMRRGRTVRIESAEELPYQIDGDLGGRTPVELEVTRTQYRILVP